MIFKVLMSVKVLNFNSYFASYRTETVFDV